jgi:four helix bundle protein
MQNYKDLKVWEKSHAFTIKVYEASKFFPKEELYGLTSQLRRAASSIPANVAEGCGRRTNDDFARHLNIALGSANEAEYFLVLAKDSGYLKNTDNENLFTTINEIKAMLIALISKVRSKI